MALVISDVAMIDTAVSDEYCFLKVDGRERAVWLYEHMFELGRRYYNVFTRFPRINVEAISHGS